MYYHFFKVIKVFMLLFGLSLIHILIRMFFNVLEYYGTFQQNANEFCKNKYVNIISVMCIFFNIDCVLWIKNKGFYDVFSKAFVPHSHLIKRYVAFLFKQCDLDQYIYQLSSYSILTSILYFKDFFFFRNKIDSIEYLYLYSFFNGR